MKELHTQETWPEALQARTIPPTVIQPLHAEILKVRGSNRRPFRQGTNVSVIEGIVDVQELNIADCTRN